MNVCMYVCMYVCPYVCMCMYLYVCVCMCMYVCMYVCTSGWIFQKVTAGDKHDIVITRDRPRTDLSQAIITFLTVLPANNRRSNSLLVSYTYILPYMRIRPSAVRRL